MGGFDNGIQFANPEPGDSVLMFATASNGVQGVYVLDSADGDVRFPSWDECGRPAGLTYAFADDGTRCFVGARRGMADEAPASAHCVGINGIHDHHMRFLAMTGLHLHTWYASNARCGVCGGEMGHSKTERALECAVCKNVVYPRISPAVIVAVTDGDKLLLTRYAQGPYRKRALVAGFIEVGESAEQAAKREVFEETGIRIKNVRYFDSQPWGLSGTLMLGFFAELDGSPEVTVQESELSEAMWVPRAEIEPDDDYALGRQMIDAFVRGALDG